MVILKTLPNLMRVKACENLSSEEKEALQKAEDALKARLKIYDIAAEFGWNVGMFSLGNC